MTIDIVIPSVGRRSTLAPLLENIRATTASESFRVIFVLDVQDVPSREEVKSFCAGDFDVVLRDGSYPEKTNAGVDAGEADLVLLTADDVVFHDQWLQAVEPHFADPALAVVGTNDLTPSTADHRHATMPVVRRSYIEDLGAAIGEPGKAFHEGYHHSFVETELWQLAVARGVAHFEPASIIEHLHPAWGTREADETDQKGNGQGWAEDQRLFKSRRALWTS